MSTSTSCFAGTQGWRAEIQQAAGAAAVLLPVLALLIVAAAAPAAGGSFPVDDVTDMTPLQPLTNPTQGPTSRAT